MTIDYWRRKKKRVALLMLGVSAVLAGLILAKTTSFFTTVARAESIVQKAAVQDNGDANDTGTCFARDKTLAETLKKNNLFVPTPPKQHPVKEVGGICGNEVLIQGKWYKVGDTLGDAKIVAIRPTQAIIEWQGAKKAFFPFDATTSEAPMRSQAKKAVVKAGKADTVAKRFGKKSMSDREGKGGGEKQRGDADWARKMSMDELREVRGDIAEYIEGLRARGVTDPEEYEDALRKMETVEDAMWEREDSK